MYLILGSKVKILYHKGHEEKSQRTQSVNDVIAGNDPQFPVWRFARGIPAFAGMTVLSFVWTSCSLWLKRLMRQPRCAGDIANSTNILGLSQKCFSTQMTTPQPSKGEQINADFNFVDNQTYIEITEIYYLRKFYIERSRNASSASSACF